MTIVSNAPGFDLSPTPLQACPALARRASVGQVFVKDEGKRPYGNFKVLGGVSASLKALARTVGVPVEQIWGCTKSTLPRLICASDGNHGLAVAVGARLAGAPATVYLHQNVDVHRIARIEAEGAKVLIVDGTYDDAVAEAAAAASRSEGLLIPDTSEDPDDPVVRDVMQGYAVMTAEMKIQFRVESTRPTHIFVQAGVGGLAATIAQELQAMMAEPRHVIVVEPEGAACVAHALNTGRIERISGDLNTSAEMLACGLASASAIRVLKELHAHSLTVDEDCLTVAVRIFRDEGMIETTPSGAAGLAGLLRVAARPKTRTLYGLTSDSVVLLVATEAPVENPAKQRNRPANLVGPSSAHQIEHLPKEGVLQIRGRGARCR